MYQDLWKDGVQPSFFISKSYIHAVALVSDKEGETTKRDLIQRSIFFPLTSGKHGVPRKPIDGLISLAKVFT